MTAKCTTVLKSLKYCQGAPVRSGIKKRVYFISTSQIMRWPTIATDEVGRPKTGTYSGSFVLAEGAKFMSLDHLVAKAKFEGKSEGEGSSKVFNTTATLLHPEVGPDSVAATAALIGDRVVALVEDINGRYRVVGSEMYDGAEADVERTNGEGPTGTAGTTITFKAYDTVDAPYYNGSIPTEDGTITPSVGGALKGEPAAPTE